MYLQGDLDVSLRRMFHRALGIVGKDLYKDLYSVVSNKHRKVKGLAMLYTFV